MDFNKVDYKELLEDSFKLYNNPDNKSTTLQDIGVQFDCNDTTKNSPKDIKNRFVEPSVVPQVFVNEYEENIDNTWDSLENAKFAHINSIITRDNFYDSTACDWKEVKSHPEGKPDYESDSGSKYWYTDSGVYRESDHWGFGVGSCDWTLNENPELSWRDNEKVRVGYADFKDFKNTEGKSFPQIFEMLTPKEAGLEDTDQNGDIYYFNYRTNDLENKNNFVDDKLYPASIETRLYTECASEGADTPQPSSVTNNVNENVVDNVSNSVVNQVGGQSGTPRNYGSKKPGATSLKNYAFELTTIEKISRGYSGYSKSNNAIQAEREGKYPISTASKIVASNFGITQQQAKWLLEQIGPCEWHHTSKEYNITYYYITKENEIVDAVSEFVEDVKNKEDVVEYVTNWYEKPEINEEGYQANFDYIIWGGTRSHPKADEQHLKNVYVIEKGSFYYVYDKKDGNFIVKKKIGSNGTYVQRLPSQEELDKQQESDRKRNALYDYNTSQETRDLINSGGSWSSSGNFYPSGKKPSPEDYNNGLENFFEIGDTRVVSTNFPGGFIMQEWDGTQFVDKEDTSNMVNTYEELPEEIKNTTSLDDTTKESEFEFTNINKLADLYGDSDRGDEIPESQNKFLNSLPVSEVDKDQKQKLMDEAKKVNKVINYIPKSLNYPFIEDEMAGNVLFFSETDFMEDLFNN